MDLQCVFNPFSNDFMKIIGFLSYSAKFDLSDFRLRLLFPENIFHFHLHSIYLQQIGQPLSVFLMTQSFIQCY
jgi:hypothetical protein